MELKCRTSDNETFNQWIATRAGQVYEVIFQAKLQINSSEKQENWPADNFKFPHFGVKSNPHIGFCILYSNRTELRDAGIYTCSKNNDDIQRSAQLIVLGK